MNIRHAYNALGEVPTPKQAFVKEIAGVAMVSEDTVRRWILGIDNPAPVRLMLLAKHFNCEVEELGLTPTETTTETTDKKGKEE